VEGITRIVKLDAKADSALDELKELFGLLEAMGLADYCTFDMSIVRGLAYYTGVVFEVQDVAGDLRAICGGGRYDNLLKDFGGPSVPATGMGMGDCVLEILLREKALLNDSLVTRSLDYFVAYTDKEFARKAIEVTAALRRAGLSADFSYKAAGLKKQLKQASDADSKKCIIIGAELTDGNKLVVKDMQTGEQELVDAGKFLAKPK
ncbi:MAG: ATP phosphoribosyltransferase regulatory subunit, partial [Planctomycetota bacterium]